MLCVLFVFLLLFLGEYYDGNWLKNHIDRIDVLVISATQSLGHLICNTTDGGYCNHHDPIDWVQGWPEGVTWPLEGVDWHGNNVRYEHKPGTMILYESAKFIHGRPFPMPMHPNHPHQKYVHLGLYCPCFVYLKLLLSVIMIFNLFVLLFFIFVLFFRCILSFHASGWIMEKDRARHKC